MATHEIIFGPPGTGKTRTLIERMQEWQRKTPGDRVLFCSHTKAAAQTAISRWGKPGDEVSIQTIHSYCFQSLNLSRSQTVDLASIRPMLAEYGLDADEGGDGVKYIGAMSYARSRRLSDREGWDKAGRPGTWNHFESFVTSYSNWKKQFGFVDFDDMLDKFVEAGDRMRNPHNLLVVDEAQDLSPAHWRVIDRLLTLNPHCKALIAGDDDQCIYEYAGASAQGMQQFVDTYSSQVEVLSQSHRVPRAVHRVANGVIHQVQLRKDKQYLPTPREGSVDRVPDMWRITDMLKAQDSLILVNDKFVRQEVEDILIENAIPYHTMGGWPSPMQTKYGQAIQTAIGTPGGFLNETQITVLKRGLTESGVSILNSIGPEPLVEQARNLDFKNFNVPWRVQDYVRRVPWKLPVHVRVSTIHQAKGMEAEDVHLITARSQAAVDGSLANPDPAHRLYYVGVTRAKNRLVIYGGDNGYEIPQ